MKIAEDQALPQVANHEGAFHGWCDLPAMRPLVVVSSPNVADPEHWKRFKPDQKVQDRVLPHFKRSVESIANCASVEGPSAPFAFGADALGPLIGYRDRTGRVLVGVGLDYKLYGCDGPSGPDWAVHWFLVDDEVLHLGGELSLVDAGDYDADGASEVVFWYAGYNKNGYVLFYDDLKQHVEHLWNYH